MVGIIGGLLMAGLLVGALLGSIWFLMGFTCAGLIVAGLTSFTTSYKEKTAASYKLSQYPPYGY